MKDLAEDAYECLLDVAHREMPKDCRSIISFGKNKWGNSLTYIPITAYTIVIIP